MQQKKPWGGREGRRYKHPRFVSFFRFVCSIFPTGTKLFHARRAIPELKTPPTTRLGAAIFKQTRHTRPCAKSRPRLSKSLVCACHCGASDELPHPSLTSRRHQCHLMSTSMSPSPSEYHIEQVEASDVQHGGWPSTRLRVLRCQSQCIVESKWIKSTNGN